MLSEKPEDFSMENKTRKIQKREQYSRKGRVNKEQVSPGLFFFYRGNCREERTSPCWFWITCL
jgi:hypothetical protein